MKRILRIFLAVMLIMQFAVQGNVFSAANGWTTFYSDEGNTNKETHFAAISEEYKYDGDKSMLVKFPGTAATNAGRYVEFKGSIKAKMESGNYTLTFYNNGRRSALTEIRIGDNLVFGYGDMTCVELSANDVPSGSSGWYKCTYDFTYTAQETDYISFRYCGGTAYTAVDEISIVAENGTENFVADCGFESTEEVEITDTPYDTTDYQASQFIASPGNGKIGLSWKNPETSELTGVAVYKITDDEWVLLSDSISVTPGAVINYPVVGLSNGTTYRFAITFTYSTKPSFTYFVNAAPAASVSKMMGIWSLEQHITGEAGYCPVATEIVTDDCKEGGAALKITSNVDSRNVQELSAEIYQLFRQNVAMEPNTKYQLKFWAKGENVEGVTMLCSWKPFNEAGGWNVSQLNGTYDWKEVILTIDTADEAPTYFHINNDRLGTVILDDIQLHKLDDAGNTIGDNLLVDGGFEGLQSINIAPLTNISLTDIRMNDMTLSWETNSSKVVGVNIYRKLFDNYEYRGTLDMENTNLMLRNLTIGTEYTYMLKPVNADGVEGVGIEVSGTTDMPDYEVTAPILYKASTKVTNLSGAGTYTAQSTIKNYKISDMSYTQVVAVYKNNVLEKLYVTPKVLATQSKYRSAVKVNTSFQIGNGEGYTAEVFILDSVDNINIISPCTIFQ